jgi:hypothetical protein
MPRGPESRVGTDSRGNGSMGIPTRDRRWIRSDSDATEPHFERSMHSGIYRLYAAAAPSGMKLT